MFFKKASLPIKVTEPIKIDINQSSDAYLYASCDENIVMAIGILAAAAVTTVGTAVVAGIEKTKIKKGCGKYAPKKETVKSNPNEDID